MLAFPVGDKVLIDTDVDFLFTTFLLLFPEVDVKSYTPTLEDTQIR